MQQLIKLALQGKSYVEGLFQQEDGQDLFEYILIIAGISLVMVVAAVIVVPDLFDAIVSALCDVVEADPPGGLGLDVGCDSLGGS